MQGAATCRTRSASRREEVNMLIISTKSEFIKLLNRIKNRVLLSLIAVISIFTALFSSGGLSVNIAGISLRFYNGAFTVLDQLNRIIIPLIVFMLCADIISHEFSDLTIKAGLLRPVGKGTLFISKWLAVVLFGSCCLGVSFIFGGIVSVVLGQMNILTAITAYIVSVLPLCASAAMAALLSSVITAPALSMFISIVVYILLNCVGFISSTWGIIFYTAHVNWYKMFTGSFSFMLLQSIVNFALMLAAYTILFLIIGKIVFSGKKV